MIIVERFQDLLEDMETYKKMFPDTHVPYNRLKEMLEEHYNDPVGSMFGIQVATTWEASATDSRLTEYHQRLRISSMPESGKHKESKV